MKKTVNTLFPAIFVLLPETAAAATLFGSTIEAAEGIFTGLQGLTIILGAIALVAFATAAIFGKLSFKWLAMILIGLFIVANAQDIANFVLGEQDLTSSSGGDSKVPPTDPPTQPSGCGMPGGLCADSSNSNNNNSNNNNNNGGGGTTTTPTQLQVAIPTIAAAVNLQNGESIDEIMNSISSTLDEQLRKKQLEMGASSIIEEAARNGWMKISGGSYGERTKEVLEKIIQDYNAGKISMNDVQKRLEEGLTPIFNDFQKMLENVMG